MQPARRTSVETPLALWSAPMAWESTTPIRRRMSLEHGRIDRSGANAIALAYPSPYRAGMSSLGFQQVYRLIQNSGDLRCERFFLPDDAKLFEVGPLSYESERPLGDFPLIAFSVAYELELAGLAQMLEASGVPALRRLRAESHPLILAGGPLTFSNPLPLGAMADVIVMGEADDLVLGLLSELRAEPDRKRALEKAAATPHVFVPALHGDVMPSIAKADVANLPAFSAIRTPDTELSNMFLIEAERGCSRACTYCVMRRSTNGGMRIVKAETLLATIPQDARRVGLVGAAVSDHPKIAEIVNALADRGCEVGLSSLRPDRLNEEFVGALKRVGYRTLTTAMDGPSDRLRELLERRARIRHLTRAAELAKEFKMKRLKLYLMIGLPTETDDDIAECAAFISDLAKTVPIALGIAPFCAKRNTPLDGSEFAGISVVENRLTLLRKLLRGRADVRGTSARWAWVEYVLAQGGMAEGEAVWRAASRGGSFAEYKRAFAEALSEAPRARVASKRLQVLQATGPES